MFVSTSAYVPAFEMTAHQPVVMCVAVFVVSRLPPLRMKGGVNRTRGCQSDKTWCKERGGRSKEVLGALMTGLTVMSEW